MKPWCFIYQDKTINNPKADSGLYWIAKVPDWNILEYASTAEEVYRTAQKTLYMKAVGRNEADWSMYGPPHPNAMAVQLEAPGSWFEVQKYIDKMILATITKNPSVNNQSLGESGT